MTTTPPQPPTYNKKPNEGIEGIYDFIKAHPTDVIAYIFLVLGLVLFFFWPLLGAGIIGILFGLYFSEGILVAVRTTRDFIEKQGLVRSLVLAATLLILLIAAPGVYIGTALGLLPGLLFTPKS